MIITSFVFLDLSSGACETSYSPDHMAQEISLYKAAAKKIRETIIKLQQTRARFLSHLSVKH